ncbi:KUP/HAK/KT family potassium transporter [Arthrobacter sp. NPDC097144]|uniref:KUP/HAK/KT family potassium transporter n=1 Tax=Arthrobacter sp. NPDC097144 TaxID=3363946 RepID=UPI0038121C55
MAPHAFTALGVVFGDIGTSPLYALSTSFGLAHDEVDQVVVYGTTSMVIWAITLVVTVLYVGILLRFDNEGEGGLLALLALLRRARPSIRLRSAATVLAVIGAAMFLGDSLITPAISVLSAVEGLETVTPGLTALVVPITLTVLFSLFLAQRFGTARIGGIFGPVMLLWFVAAAVFGLLSLAQTPGVILSLSPHWIVLLVIADPKAAFLTLGGVVLAVTGAEALFADMGHFGRRPITLAWLAVVFPSLIITYLGQAASVLRNPADAGGAFFATVPGWAAIPMVVLATAATVIAPQAVISGAFSMVQQASQLDLLPRFRVIHTSASERGQIYLPGVNLLLAVAVTTLALHPPRH